MSNIVDKWKKALASGDTSAKAIAKAINIDVDVDERGDKNVVGNEKRGEVEEGEVDEGDGDESFTLERLPKNLLGEDGYLDSDIHKYKVEALRGECEGVNPRLKELYLIDEEFEEVFGMCREDFEGLRKWKQQGLKKKVGLF